MFDLANDRLSYSEMLRPDVGYTLDFAVGTTYSLDLEALLGVPVSMGLLEDGDTEQLRNPLYVLEAIRASADKIAIFCAAGASLPPGGRYTRPLGARGSVGRAAFSPPQMVRGYIEAAA